MGQVAIGGILLAIGIVLLVTVFPVIRTSVERAITNNTASTTDDISGTDATLMRLIPTVFIFGMIGAGLGFLIQGFRTRGN